MSFPSILPYIVAMHTINQQQEKRRKEQKNKKDERKNLGLVIRTEKGKGA